MEVTEDSYSKQTLSVTNRNINNWIIPQLGDYFIIDLNPKILEKFVLTLKENKLSPSTIKRIFIIIRSALQHAENLEIINKNPAEKVKLPSIKKKEEKIWSESEVKLFFENANSTNPSFYIAYLLAYYTGARQAEILGLPWSNVNFVNNCITISQTLINNGKEISLTTKNETSKRIIGLLIL
ncbi:tyrosine-type recombinase/integrase [Cytobacillus horneckiae]|uniref:tyrosine-type recombinase/integrase n=1 Tax=Cytobacillus horneckiae TaxID=549687 RepID=UPI0039A24D38